eukprot:scaffold106740_cov70-Phaeocystis_antarctica.AAC.3
MIPTSWALPLQAASAARLDLQDADFVRRESPSHAPVVPPMFEKRARTRTRTSSVCFPAKHRARSSATRRPCTRDTRAPRRCMPRRGARAHGAHLLAAGRVHAASTPADKRSWRDHDLSCDRQRAGARGHAPLSRVPFSLLAERVALWDQRASTDALVGCCREATSQTANSQEAQPRRSVDGHRRRVATRTLRRLRRQVYEHALPHCLCAARSRMRLHGAPMIATLSPANHSQRPPTHCARCLLSPSMRRGALTMACAAEPTGRSRLLPKTARCRTTAFGAER